MTMQHYKNTSDQLYAIEPEFQRDHPLVVSLGAALGKIPEELDALFALAVTL